MTSTIVVTSLASVIPKADASRRSYLGLLFGKLFDILSTDIASINDNYICTATSDVQIPFKKKTKVTRIQPVTGLQRLLGYPQDY